MGSREVIIPSSMFVLKEPQSEDLLRRRKRHFITRNPYPKDPTELNLNYQETTALSIL